MDLYGEWEVRKATRGAAYHKSGSVSSATVTTVTPGWWKLSMLGAFRWLGPETTSATILGAVSDQGQHEWLAAEPVFVSRETTAWVAFVPEVTSVTTWYLDRVRSI